MSYAEIRGHAKVFGEMQEARIAYMNRLQAAGVPKERLKEIERFMTADERGAAKLMIAAFRSTVAPAVIEWQRAEKGIGEHLLARLIGEIGHPRIAMPYHWEGSKADRILVADEPFDRTVSQLWSYCGHGDPTRKRRAGMDKDEAMALGKDRAKSLVWNLSKSCMMTDGHYRVVYDKRRIVTEGREHATDCARCGPSGHPAKAGTPWSKAHQLADALRIVGKEILRDLWVVAG